jgi:probable molybdopterin binding protein
VRLERLTPGSHAPHRLEGSVLARDVFVAGSRWSKGRRLSRADLDAFTTAPPSAIGAVTVILLDDGDLHEDEAATRLAFAVSGSGLAIRSPVQSRVDLVATDPGVVHVRIADLERINRLDPLEVFTRLDGSIVEAGDLVASVKIAPHVVAGSVVEAGAAIASAARPAVVRVAAFRPMTVGVVVKESLRRADRPRFEETVRTKVESLGSTIQRIDYVDDEDAVVRAALERLSRGGGRVDAILTAGGRSTDPSDAFFTAIEALGGEIVRRGVPAHPGSMLWLGRIGRTAVLGLPTCGAYSKATAADLLLPRLLTGEPPTKRTVSALGHGGVLTREMRFRFPAYARDLDAPDG